LLQDFKADLEESSAKVFFNISKNLLVTAFFGQTIGWYESLKKAYRIAQNSVRKAIEKTGK